MANFIVLFKTGDLFEAVEKKAPFLLKTFAKLQKMPFLYTREGKRYSPRIITRKM